MENKTTKKPGKAGIIAISIIFGLTVIINILFRIFSGYADLYLGTGKAIIETAEGTEDWDSQYYIKDYDDKEALQKAAARTVEEIEAEGIVLMKNNGALPLSGKKVTLMGRDAVDAVFGGSGSGSVDISTVIDLKTGLKEAGFAINETVYDLYDSFASYSMGYNSFGQPIKKYDNPKADIIMDKPKDSSYYVGEMPISQFSNEDLASFSDYNDAAILMFGRGGGEGGDLTKDMKGFDENYQLGQHQLELNKDEKDLLALAKKNFDKVVVIINSSAAMELGILENDPDIDAILWVGSPGQTGFLAVGKVLSGTVNPSGRTADIYASDFTKDPTFVNFGNYQYSNINKRNSNGDGFFVQYEEGIYMGYRYYETAAAENFIDYDEAVVYPFGYGLSYTDFSWEITHTELENVKGTIKVDVKVTNTGDTYAGKDVVQLYYSAPYHKGGIEKSEVVLGDFVKTGLLQPGQSETVTLTLPVEEMASYDYKVNKAYVLDEGEYSIRLQTDSHNMKEGLKEIIYEVNKTVVYDGNNHRTSDMNEVTNQFDDVSALFSDTKKEGFVTNMTRSDFAGTFPTAPTTADMLANEDILEAFKVYFAFDHLNEEAEIPRTGAKNGISLINMRGRDYSDPLWETFLDQLYPDEIIAVVINSAYNTAAIESVDKPATVDLDGPSGITSFIGAEVHGTAYPSAAVLGASFNPEMGYKMGTMVGNEGLFYKVNGWYAPAMNLHRSPFAGRNFEYYSEDPILSGKMATACVEGTASKGVYAFIKHFAMNDQETNRMNNGVSTWANEQTIRELYLKPFEMTVKNATASIRFISDEEGTVSEKKIPATTALMSSFNRIGGTWTGGSVALMQNVLRDEWGFKGVVISDFNLYDYMDVNQGLAAGTDINITFSSMKTIDDTESPTFLNNLRRTAHRLCYTVANSNAMNGIVPGATVTFTRAPWIVGLFIADGLILLILGLWSILLIRKRKRG